MLYQSNYLIFKYLIYLSKKYCNYCFVENDLMCKIMYVTNYYLYITLIIEKVILTFWTLVTLFNMLLHNMMFK